MKGRVKQVMLPVPCVCPQYVFQAAQLMLYKDDSTQTGSVLFGRIIWRQSLTCNLGLLSL